MLIRIVIKILRKGKRIKMKKTIKTMIAILMISLLSISLVACKKNDDSEDKKEVASADAKEDETKDETKDEDNKDEDGKEETKDEDKKDEGKDEDKKEDSKDSKKEDKKENKKTSKNKDPYADLIKDVKKACKAGMKDSDIDKLNISYVFSLSANTLGYAKIDLDNNGVDELIFGETEADGRNTVYDIFTSVDGKLKKVASGGERNTYIICKDNIIKNNASNSAASGSINFYKLSNAKLKLVEGLEMKDTKNKAKPWFYKKGESSKKAKNISETQKDEIEDKYKIKKVSFTKFM